MNSPAFRVYDDHPEPRVVREDPIETTVSERGFALYEWISSDELRISLERDYLDTVRYASIPLAIITAIAGLIGSGAGIGGIIFAVLAVLGIFYLLVAVYLTVKFLKRSYLYTRMGTVAITDSHYVSGGAVIEKDDTAGVEKLFSRVADTFDEPFLGESRLQEKKEKSRQLLWENLKEIAQGGGNILSKVGNSRDSGGIVIVVFIAGTLYAIMMGAIYFIGIFFIALLGRISSMLAHSYLLSTHDREYTIQSLFSKIEGSSRRLSDTQRQTISLLDEARRNEWKDSLLTKINSSNELLAQLASTATDDTRRLREILESSQYREIFNFSKYGNWVKKQILEPLDEIYLLLSENRDRIAETIEAIGKQISGNASFGKEVPTKEAEDFSEKTGTNPPTPLNRGAHEALTLQKSRLIAQRESFEKIMVMIDGYREKLRG